MVIEINFIAGNLLIINSYKLYLNFFTFESQLKQNNIWLTSEHL